MAATTITYQARKILNKYKHVDGGWFWVKYSAYPYIGCQFGCEFCYEREPKYLPFNSPDDFDKVIKIKLNAPALLKKELTGVPVDLLSTCDYQPAEKEFGISRQLLEVALEANFPVFILDRSPLVIRDLDLIKAINRATFATVLFSIGFVDNKTTKKAFEPKSPAVKLRFKAMERISSHGILTGTCFMPILPFITDSESNIEEVIRMTKDCGGSFVLANSLTLSGNQRERCLNVIAKYYPGLINKYNDLYRNSYSPTGEYWVRIARNVREMCLQHGMKDRMPRWIPQSALAINKRIAEMLFLKVYDMELSKENTSKIWAYRKAAWTIDEIDKSIAEIYADQGVPGLLALPDVGKQIAIQIEKILKDINPGLC